MVPYERSLKSALVRIVAKSHGVFWFLGKLLLLLFTQHERVDVSVDTDPLAW